MAAVLGAVALAAPAPASGAIGCGSGFTEYEAKGVRLFGAYTGEDLSLYACTARRPRPARIWAVSPATTSELFVHGRTGSRLAISLEEFADGGNGVWVGWFDVRTGRRALRSVKGPSDRPDPEDNGSDFTRIPTRSASGATGRWRTPSRPAPAPMRCSTGAARRRGWRAASAASRGSRRPTSSRSA